jgi:hypothetical protein
MRIVPPGSEKLWKLTLEPHREFLVARQECPVPKGTFVRTEPEAAPPAREFSNEQVQADDEIMNDCPIRLS